jgi:alpha-tubulin suppressor-like RCC1 family protein
MSNVYTISTTNGEKEIQLYPGQVNGYSGVNNETDLKLYGLGSLSWASGINENLLRMLENFSVPKKQTGDYNPLTGNNDYNELTDNILPKDFKDLGDGLGINTPIIGQLWFNTTDNSIFVYSNNHTWIPVGSTTIVNKPLNPEIGTIWFDIDNTTPTSCVTSSILKIYNPTDPNADVEGWVMIIDAAVKRCGDTMTGFLTLHDDPTDNLHSATKQYVDSMVGSALGSDGGSLTNFLTLHADPINNLHAATKQYVDNNDLLKVNKSGDTMTGHLTLPGNPVNPNHAANKQYADNLHVLQVNKAGDTMTGHLTLPTSAVHSPYHAVQKYYVDNADDLKLNISGGTLTGMLSTPPTMPTDPLHVTPKQYVDASIGTLESDLSQVDYKIFAKKVKHADAMVIVVNNQIFISGIGADYVGKSNKRVRGFVYMPFHNSYQIPLGTTIHDIVCNGASMLVALSNGWCYSWGLNANGQLGQGDTTARYTLTRIEYFINNGISIDKVWMNSELYSGTRTGGCSFFRGTNGILYGCGHNASGTLGIGNFTTTISTPTQVLNITNVIDLQVTCASHGNVLATTSNNLRQVWSWGDNGQGQLGRGNTTNQHTPAVCYTDTTHDITKVVAVNSNFYSTGSGTWTGGAGSSYILAGGVIRSCGYNAHSQLGIGNTTNQSNWQTLSGSNWSDIEANGGYQTSFYALQNGTVFSCGDNNYGQLGHGDTVNKNVLTTTGLTNVEKIIAGQNSSYATTICMKTDKTLWGCGYGGSGTLLQNTLPVSINTTFLPMAIPRHSPIKDVVLLYGTYNRYDNSLFILLENNTLYSAGANDSYILSNQDVSSGNNNGALSVVQFVYK